ncbi:hypothetical protein BY996DRAFT_6416157 [Phakopsora pachyrhizi]|nr:hypothetical protein BY996DRAFT_6416157 [Phakopsora pachyrhizi]
MNIGLGFLTFGICPTGQIKQLQHQSTQTPLQTGSRAYCDGGVPNNVGPIAFQSLSWAPLMTNLLAHFETFTDGGKDAWCCAVGGEIVLKKRGAGNGGLEAQV